MIFDQTTSRSIRSRNQAMIRIGGEQGREAVSSCFLAGATARGLSWRMLRLEGNPMIYLPVIGQDHINRMETEARVSMFRCDLAARLRERSLKRRWWRQQKLRVFIRDRFTCQYCYRVFYGDLDLLTVDHITPKAAGGTNEMGNLLTACLSCNTIKANTEVEDVDDARQVVLASRARLREWMTGELAEIGHEMAVRHPK